MTQVSQTTFYLAAFFYTLSWITALGRCPRVSLVLLAVGLGTNFWSIVCRYVSSWPLLSMFQGPFFLPFFLGVLSFKIILRTPPESLLLISLIFILAGVAILFPKDCYLPFLQSKTVFAHLFFLSGVIARACFFIAAVQAFVYLCPDSLVKIPAVPRDDLSFIRWIIGGFAFLTLAMFCGEMWSYLGWGSPVLWDDAMITTTMATWFYYVGFLHLHLFKNWSLEKRSCCAAVGALLVFIFNCYPEMGKYQVPNLQWW
ncbi:MAG: hypothetical protein DRG58_08240 [Deltaproteobacteria bacterium]|nr:MAG: hypothetical protein DRG58_08240 [Deltaproteobacteria bacterium]